MRITFLLPPDTLAGGMRVVASYAQHLANRGHTVHAIQPRHPRRSIRETWRSLIRDRHWPVDFDGGPSHFDNLDIVPNRGTFTRIKLSHSGAITAADVPDADVVIATWWETAEWAAQFPPSKGTKVYFIQHHEIHMWGQPADRVNATWRLPLKKIVIAPWLAELARKKFDDHDVAIVPNALDTGVFFATPRGKQTVPTVGFIFSRAHFKGPDIAIKALELARREVPTLRIFSFGAEEPLPHMPLPAGTAFTYKPSQETIRELYSSCDAWLFSSRVEGFGLPILEAMACRTPVIGTPAGAAPELLTSGGGNLVPMEDSQAMANAIVSMTQLSELKWREMSDIAYATATGYTWEDATDRFEASLQQALEPRSAELQSVGGG